MVVQLIGNKELLTSEFINLQSHTTEWSRKDSQEWIKAMQFIVHSTNTAYSNEWLEWISKIESNSFGIWIKDEVAGRVIHPSAALFNHSCEPNCVTFKTVVN